MMNPIKYIFNKIAFDMKYIRIKTLPYIDNFLNFFDQNANILDIGCGTGINMQNKNLNFKGIDISDRLVRICQRKNLNVIEANMLKLPQYYFSFDGFIAINSYHHLLEDSNRKEALNEMFRILKPHGLGLITVWAVEQDEESILHLTEIDELVKIKCCPKYKYYKPYFNNELATEIKKLEPRFTIEAQGWYAGTWWVIVQKHIIRPIY